MSAKLNLYNLGALGVNVDKSPIHKEDGELLRAQNVTTDPLGVQGGIRKRPGLVKVNSSAAAGSIQGITPIPIAKPTTRTFIFGRYTNDTTAGWNTSTDGFATSPTTGGPDGFSSTAVPRTPTKVWTNYNNSTTNDDIFVGRPSITYRNRFYYAGNDYTVGTSAPTIHMWDGVTDYVLATIPDNPDDAGATSSAILCMIAANQRIYITTYDGGSAAATTCKGCVFELTPENGALVQLGSRFPISPDTQRIPYSLAWHMGRLWVGAHAGGGGATSTTKTYFLRPGIDSDWTLDNTSSGTTCAMEMMSFQGQLYQAHGAGSGAGAKVWVRSTLAAYTTSVTAALNEGGSVPVMANFGVNNHFGAMSVFGGNLYVAYYNKSTTNVKYARVYKYTGSAWSVVYFPAADDAASVPYHGALVHNGVLYMWSSPVDAASGSNDINRLIYTSDGTTWTAVGSILDNFSASSFGVIVT